MTRDLGRLRSPLSDAELVLKMIRELRLLYNSRIKQLQGVARKDLGNVVKYFMEELREIGDIAEKSKVMEIRILESMNSFESTLNSYRRNIKNRLRKLKKGDPLYQHLLQMLNMVISILNNVREIKRKFREEAGRAMQEDRTVYRKAA